MLKLQTFLQKLSATRKRSLFLDLMMLLLVAVDLTWMLLDLVLMQFSNSYLGWYFPAFSSWYKTSVHPLFLTFDGLVIFIFIAEFFTRWFFAVWRKTYSKWFFFPIAHWYDLLGSIPSSAFRFVRLFRIVGMAYRLHRWGLINLNDYYLFRQGVHYYQILMEEISDRVAVKILDDVKDELLRKPPLTEQIIDKVVYPKKEILAIWISTQIQKHLRDQYADYREDWRQYVQKTVQQAMDQNKEVGNLERIPMLGGYLKETLNQAVSQIVFGVLDKILQDASHTNQHGLIAEIADGILELLLQDEQRRLQNLSNEVVTEAIDVIIERVQEKKWKTE